MKTLCLIRHAKSSWEINVADWQRPLTEEGIFRAQKVACILKANKITPDKIISSHAFRALNTAIIFAGIIKVPADQIEVSYRIYEKKADDVIDLLRNVNDKYESVMIFGHNPCITNLYNFLSGRQLDNMGTSAAACLQFDIHSWNNLAPQGKTVFFETGKE